jgi:ABC-2 type transport system permease protein
VAETRVAETWTHDLVVYRHLVGARARSEWQYRTSFVLFCLANALVVVSELAAVAVVMSNVDDLAGWSTAEVLLLAALSGIAFAAADLLASPVERVAHHVKEGTFDQFLTRPAGTLSQLLGREFALRRIGRLAQPFVLLVVVLALVPVAWSPAHVVLLVLTVVSGTVIYASVWVVTSSVAFWTVETQEMANSFTYGGNSMNRYPIEILGGWMRRIVTFVVPLAFVAYMPTAWILDKPLPFGLPGWVAWAGPLVALAMVGLTRLVWRFSVRHYRSTGS